MKKFSKRELERIYFDVFNKITGELNGFNFEPDESPDFKINCLDEILGLEITRIFKNEEFDGRPEEGIENEEFYVVMRAKDMAVNKGL